MQICCFCHLLKTCLMMFCVCIFTKLGKIRGRRSGQFLIANVTVMHNDVFIIFHIKVKRKHHCNIKIKCVHKMKQDKADRAHIAMEYHWCVTMAQFIIVLLLGGVFRRTCKRVTQMKFFINAQKMGCFDYTIIALQLHFLCLC